MNDSDNNWGREHSEHNLRSNHYDLDYLVLYVSFGGHPADNDMTDEQALEWTLDSAERSRLSPDHLFRINISALNEEDRAIAWSAVETFTLLTGLSITETQATTTPTYDDPNVTGEEFAAIYFEELAEGTGASGRVWPAATPVYPGNNTYINTKIAVVPNQHTGYKKSTYIHEVAHAHWITGTENGQIDPVLDNIRLTTVSYNSPFGGGTGFDYLERTPMLADILAIDLMWGLADEILHGNTTYGRTANTGMAYDDIFHEMAEPGNRNAITIMDTGGYDTLDFSDHNATSHGQTLRLNMNPYWTSDVYSTAGNFIIGPDTWIEAAIAGDSDDHITGNILDNYINANAGNDTVLAGPGDDVLQGGPGRDQLDGGDGLDVASYADHPGNQVLTFDETGMFGDTFISIEGLRTGAGNDTLIGDDNDNILEGGPGADTLTGNAGNDTASYLTSPGPVTVRLHNASASGNDAEGDIFRTNSITGLSDIENLLGSRYDDTLAGDSRNNILTGKGGNDKLYGGPGGGDDTLSGNDGNDQMWGGQGNDILDGGPGNDKLNGGPGADILIGGMGNDTAIFSGPGPVTARLHNATITGNEHVANDSFGQIIQHTYLNDEGIEITEQLPDIENLIGTDFNDTLAGDARDNILTGNGGNDTLYGGPGGGDDIMIGGPGNDALYGGQGKDTLIGGPGNDRLIGGPDADIFVFGPGHGNDTIKGFNTSEDQIDLTAFDVPENFTPELTTVGDDTLLNLASLNGGEVLFEDVTLSPESDTFII